MSFSFIVYSLLLFIFFFFFFFSSRRRHTRLQGDWSSDVCSSDLALGDDFKSEKDRVSSEIVAQGAAPYLLTHHGIRTSNSSVSSSNLGSKWVCSPCADGRKVRRDLHSSTRGERIEETQRRASLSNAHFFSQWPASDVFPVDMSLPAR